MYKFCNLFSGSSGNCSFIKTDHLNILVDFGISYKKTCEALNSIGESISDIDAIFITHEHSDHTKGLKTLLNNFDIPIYANKKTLSELQKQAQIKSYKVFKNNENISLEDLTITPFSIYHDAADPVAFTFQQKKKKLSLCTDLGHVDNKILKHLEGSDLMLLESNYEPDLLKCSRYPYMLKQRILGPNGHLSNSDCAGVISDLSSSGIKNVFLGHLSKENNFPELAYKISQQELEKLDNKKIKITVALRDVPNKLVDI